MRALVLDPAGNLFGSERVLIDFVRAVRGSRWSVTVCTPPGPLAARLRDEGVPVFDTFRANLHHKGRPARALATLALLHCALRVRPQVIAVNQAGATRIALAVGRLLRVPVVPHVRIVEDIEYLTALGASERSLPALVCVSDFIRKRFVSLRPRCHRIYDPFEPRVGTSQPVESSTGRLRIVCVGRIVPDKGQHLVVEALAILCRRGIDAQVRLVGPSQDLDYQHALDRRIAELALQDRVEQLAFQPDVYPHLREADVLVCPSREEPLGRVLFEAWDAGTLPIAYAQGGGTAEVLAASGAGVMFERSEGASLADAIERAAAITGAERAALIARGRAWCRSELSPTRCSEQVLQIWDEVAR